MRILESLLDEFFDIQKFHSKAVGEINALPEEEMKSLTGLTTWDDLNRFRDAWLNWEKNQDTRHDDWKDSLTDFCGGVLRFDGEHVNTEDIRTKVFGDEGSVV